MGTHGHSRGRATKWLYTVNNAPWVRDEIAPRVRSTPEAELLGALRQSRRQRLALDIERDGQVLVREPEGRDRQSRIGNVDGGEISCR